MPPPLASESAAQIIPFLPEKLLVQVMLHPMCARDELERLTEVGVLLRQSPTDAGSQRPGLSAAPSPRPPRPRLSRSKSTSVVGALGDDAPALSRSSSADGGGGTAPEAAIGSRRSFRSGSGRRRGPSPLVLSPRANGAWSRGLRASRSTASSPPESPTDLPPPQPLRGVTAPTRENTTTPTTTNAAAAAAAAAGAAQRNLATVQPSEFPVAEYLAARSRVSPSAQHQYFGKSSREAKAAAAERFIRRSRSAADTDMDMDHPPLPRSPQGRPAGLAPRHVPRSRSAPWPGERALGGGFRPRRLQSGASAAASASPAAAGIRERGAPPGLSTAHRPRSFNAAAGSTTETTQKPGHGSSWR